MKKLILFTLCSIYLFTSAFVERGNFADTPGIIRAIGNAGSDNVFTFKKWQFLNVEMPEENVENIKATIEITTSSLTTDWKDLEKNIRKKKDYFYVKKFPKATVEINGAEAIGDGKYKTQAMLTLKSYTKPVELVFTISDTKPYVVKGEGVITRQDFGFTGGGPKNEVPVSFEAELPL